MLNNILIIFFCSFLVACSDNEEEAIPLSSSSVEARTFAPLKGTPMLTITGAITQKNTAQGLVLDLDTLLSFKQHTVKTTTIWTDGTSSFTGPLVRDVLSAAGNSAKFFSAVAINEYSVEVPVADTVKYPVIFALQKDGKTLSVREKGPIWIIYPWSSTEALNQDKYYSRSIWQLIRINLHD